MSFWGLGHVQKMKLINYLMCQTYPERFTRLSCIGGLVTDVERAKQM